MSNRQEVACNNCRKQKVSRPTHKADFSLNVPDSDQFVAAANTSAKIARTRFVGL
jgi:hypothetical protein